MPNELDPLVCGRDYNYKCPWITSIAYFPSDITAELFDVKKDTFIRSMNNAGTFVISFTRLEMDKLNKYKICFIGLSV